MTISVIIPTYNSKHTLGACIRSILEQSIPIREVIVVDNASTDGTPTYVKKRFPKVKIVTMDRNTGVTGGRNAGIAHANKKSDYLLFFDHDMVADQDMVKNLVSVASQNKNTGIVTPKIYYLSDKKRIWSAGTGMNLWTGQVLFRGGRDKGQYDEAMEVQVAPASMLVSRQVISKIKGFDDQYFAVYEDTDFCFRAKKKGFKTMFSPHATAYHDLSVSEKDEAKRLLSRGYWVGRNRVLFMKEFGNNYYVFLAFLPIYIVYYLKLALRFSDIDGFFAYLRGTLAAIFGDNFELPYSYIWAHKKAIRPTDSVLDLGCGDGRFLSDLVGRSAIKAWGVDLHADAANAAMSRGLYQKVIKGDVTSVAVKLAMKHTKFDVVICSQLLEHLEKSKGETLLRSMETIAKRSIIVGTPRGFMAQPKEYYKGNPLQEHKSGWKISDFTSLGYHVYGVGFYPLWTEHGLARSKNKMVSFVSRLISLLLSPLVYYVPSLASGLVCIKEK